MAGNTFSRRSRIGTLGMTGCALNITMAIIQRVEAMVEIVTQERNRLSGYAGRSGIIRPDNVYQLPGTIGHPQVPHLGQQRIELVLIFIVFTVFKKVGQDAFGPLEEQVKQFQ